MRDTSADALPTDHRTPRGEDRASTDPHPPKARTDRVARPDRQLAAQGPRPANDSAKEGARPAHGAAGGGCAAGGPDADDGPGVDVARGRVAGAGAGEARELGRRMKHAVHDFVDDPRRAVREADAVLDEVIARLERAVEARRDALRAGSAAGADTEALRVSLTRYRDLAERLLVVAPYEG